MEAIGPGALYRFHPFYPFHRYYRCAEVPDTFSSLPTVISGMYSPELKGNTEEMRYIIGE